MSMAASPAVADRIGARQPRISSQHYLVVLPVALAVMFVVSLLTPRDVRRLGAGRLRRLRSLLLA